MKLAAILAAVLLALTPAGSMDEPPTLRILTVGDSMSELGKWQAELCRLMAQDADLTCDVRNEAVGGTTCGYWPSRIVGLLNIHQPDLLIIACGTNDDARTQAQRDALGMVWRQTVEAVYTWRTPHIPIVPVLVQYSDQLIAPQWRVDSQPLVNDTLFENMGYYLPAGWFQAVIDWQVIPSTPTYLLREENGQPAGIHPTPRGYAYMGRLAYDRLAAGLGWPATSEPALCDLYGTRRPYPRPAYTPCLAGGE